jgi:hypothetical protein
MQISPVKLPAAATTDMWVHFQGFFTISMTSGFRIFAGFSDNAVKFIIIYFLHRAGSNGSYTIGMQMIYALGIKIQ